MDPNSEIALPLFLILCGVLGMLTLAIAIVVFILVYQKRLFAQKENIQKMEREYQKDMLQFSFEAQEAERKRIASDLHDDIGSILSAAKIYVNQLNPSADQDSYQELKSESTELIDNALVQIRNISHNLFPPNLEHVGFIQACEDLCLRIEKMKKIDVVFDYVEVPRFSKQKELSLYRILQELTNNTLKHAEATKIKLKFRSKGDSFEFYYKDNGKGFDFENKDKAEGGLGMKSIESRANSINASIEINTQIGSGFEFILALDERQEEK